MKKILSFDKPEKIRSTEEHNKMFSSDSGVAGTFVPNMSKDDKLKWKAKHIKGKDERIEIRKTLNGVNILLVVYKNHLKTKSNDWRDHINDHNDIKMSMNGKLDMTYDNWFDLQEAVREAIEILL